MEAAEKLLLEVNTKSNVEETVVNKNSQEKVMSDIHAQQSNIGDKVSESLSYLWNLMKSKKWFAVLTAIEVEAHLAYSRISEEDEAGKTTIFLPIHAAVTLKAPALIIGELLSINPASTLSRNEEGRVPLHLAVLHDATFEVFHKLLCTSTEAMEVADNAGKTPLHFHLEAYYSRRKVTSPCSTTLIDADYGCAKPMKKIWMGSRRATCG